MNPRRAPGISAVLFSLLLLGGFGCLSVPEQKNAPLPEPPSPRPVQLPAPEPEPRPVSRAEDWHTVAPGMERAVLESESDDGLGPVAVTLYRLDAAQFGALLMNDAANPKTVAGWADTRPEAALVINAAYFNDQLNPTGFMVVDGVRMGVSAFDLDKSGLLVLEPEFRIVDTKSEPVSLEDPALRNVMQSYPFLISGGKPVIQKDSGQISYRSFVGLDESGRIYVGSVTDSIVSLYGLMEILDDAGVEWTQVLNLDGGSSAGLVARHDGAPKNDGGLVRVPSALFFVRR